MNNFADAVKEKSDQELMGMIYQIGEWNPEMLQAVENELSARNILPHDVNTKKQEAIKLEDEQLTKGREASSFGQVIGWILVIGIFGIVIGYNYAFSKVTSRYTGKKYFKYNEATRKNGTNMFYVAICVSALSVLYRVITARGVNI